MAHLPPIVADLAMILLVAGITTILFKKLNQPLVLLPVLLPDRISTFSLLYQTPLISTPGLK